MKQRYYNHKPFASRRIHPITAWNISVFSGVEGYEKLEVVCVISKGRFFARKGYQLIRQESWTEKGKKQFIAIYYREISKTTLMQKIGRWFIKKLRIVGLRIANPIRVVESQQSL